MTNKSEWILALETETHRVWFRRELDDEHFSEVLQKAPEDFARQLIEQRSDGYLGMAFRVESKLQPIKKCQAELAERSAATAKMYGWPVVAPLQVKHEPAYVPGKRDYTKLIEAAKRKPVGYVTDKSQVLAATNPVKSSSTAENGGWPKYFHQTDKFEHLYVVHSCEPSISDCTTFWGGGNWERFGKYVHVDKFHEFAHPISEDEAIKWFRANGHAAKADRIEGVEYEPVGTMPVVGDVVVRRMMRGAKDGPQRVVAMNTQKAESDHVRYILSDGAGAWDSWFTGNCWRVLKRKPIQDPMGGLEVPPYFSTLPLPLTVDGQGILRVTNKP